MRERKEKKRKREREREKENAYFLSFADKIKIDSFIILIQYI